MSSPHYAEYIISGIEFLRSAFLGSLGCSEYSRYASHHGGEESYQYIREIPFALAR